MIDLYLAHLVDRQSCGQLELVPEQEDPAVCIGPYEPQRHQQRHRSDHRGEFRGHRCCW